jgi:hypothetical protein
VSTIRQRERRSTPSRASAWAAALCCCAIGAAALARPVPWTETPDRFDDAAPDRPMQRGGLSLQQAIDIATQRYGGRVVRADTTIRNGRQVYEIRILGDDNVVRTIRIDAQSGELR